MMKFSTSKFNENKFYKFSSFIYLLLPIAIISGNFFTNFLIVYSIVLLSVLILIRKNKNNLNVKEIIYISIFFLYLIINSFLNSENDTILTTLKYVRFYFYSIAIFFLLYFYRKFFENLTFSFFIIFLLLIFDGFFQYFNGINIIGFKQETPHRISSFFGDEFILGSFISKYLAFIILYFLINKKYFFLLFPLLFLLLILSFISGERTAFATTLLISFFTLIKLYNFKKIIFFFSISITSLFLIVTLDEVVNHRMIYSTIEDTKLLKEWKNPKSLKIYSDQHNSHFQSAYLMYKKGNFSEKIFGRGIKSFRKNCSLKKFCDEINCCSTHPHNIFLQILSEIGLIGLFFYLYFFLYLLYNSILFLLKKIENEKYIILTSILFNYLPFLTSGNIFGTFLSTNIFLLIAILIYFNNKKTENSMNE